MNQKDTMIRINEGLVAFHPISGLRTIYLNLSIRSGSWYENGDNWGEMHLLEHLLFHGTEKFPTKTLLDDFMEDNGIQCNGYTSGSKIEIVMRFPDSSIDNALLLLSQMVHHPLLRQQDLTKESRVINREYTDKWSKPDARFSRKIREQLFGDGSMYVRDGIGNPKYVDSLTEQKLKDTRSKYFVPANMYIGMSGGLDVPDITKKLEMFFAGDSGVAAILPSMTIRPDKNILNIYEENIISSNISVSWLIKGIYDYTIPERILLSFGSYLLGGSRRSLLNKKIRDEQGLAYGISTNITLFPSCGWFQVNTSTKPESTSEVIEQIRKSVSGFINQEIDEANFQRAKKYIKWQRLLQYDSGSSAASNLSDSLYWDKKLISAEEFEAAVDGITVKDLDNLYSKIVASEPYISIMEPTKY